MIRTIKAEFIKLKYPPILWLIAATVVSISILIYFAHYNDVESVSAIGKNPWTKIWQATIGFFSIFLNVPFLILLISASVFIEHQNSTWKYQYAAPVTRTRVLFNKLFTLFLVIILTYIVLAFLTFFVAYALNFMLPETEFSYYPLQFEKFSTSAFFTLINSLGIIGIQFFLSNRFKGFLLPAAVGIVAFIIGLILGITNTPISHYFPYAYPLIGQDFQMFNIDKIGIIDWGWINSVQICSVFTFIGFITLGLISENRRVV